MMGIIQREIVGNIVWGKKYLVLIFLFIFSVKGLNLNAQTGISKEEIDRKFEKAREYSNLSNPDKAIELLKEIEEDCKSIGYLSAIPKVGYMLSIIYFNSTDYSKVISLPNSYLEIGNNIRDYENVAHIHRIKAGAYSELGLMSKASAEYELALKYARKIQSFTNKQNAISLIYSNLANLHIKSGSQPDSIFLNIKKGIAEAEKIPESEESIKNLKYSIIAYSHIMLANQYEKMENYKMAEEYYLKALDIQNSNSVPLVEKVVLLNQLAYFYYDQKQYEVSVQYAEMGLALEKKSSLPQLRKDLFEVLSKSYMELNENEKSKSYLRQFTALNDSLAFTNKKAVEEALNQSISQKKEQLNAKEAIIYSLILLVVIIFGASFYFYSRKQKQYKRVEKILDDLKSKSELKNSKVERISTTENTEVKEEKNPIMPVEAELKLLEKLAEFEKKQLFLERKVTLPFVASEIETNTKYLSYIIKKHKGKDFNEYINDLRINYIVQKLTEDPVYRQYKINTLAEECGFSSHSKFTTVFKASFGVSPSEFIKYLKHKN